MAEGWAGGGRDGRGGERCGFDVPLEMKVSREEEAGDATQTRG